MEDERKLEEKGIGMGFTRFSPLNLKSWLRPYSLLSRVIHKVKQPVIDIVSSVMHTFTNTCKHTSRPFVENVYHSEMKAAKGFFF
jgi:hypothetical protein